MKKKFEVPACAVTRFTWKDVICTSGKEGYTVNVVKGAKFSGSGAKTDVAYNNLTQ